MFSNFCFSDDDNEFSLRLSESEMEEEGVEEDDPSGTYSVIINWLYKNCATVFCCIVHLLFNGQIISNFIYFG